MQKSLKKMWNNIFSTNFGRLNMHKTFTSNILILLFKNATPFKINAKKVIIIQNMLEFEIKKINENSNTFLYSKQIKCLWKATNNHFGATSKNDKIN